MTRRKGEITVTQVKRDWPHHVELLAEQVKGNENFTTVNKFASTLSVAPLPYTQYYDDIFHIVFASRRPTMPKPSPSGSTARSCQRCRPAGPAELDALPAATLIPHGRHTKEAAGAVYGQAAGARPQGADRRRDLQGPGEIRACSARRPKPEGPFCVSVLLPSDRRHIRHNLIR
jgi:hypothetical protein